MTLIAHMHGDGIRYFVTFDGEIVLKGSRDPEPDLAHVLLARGITGHVKVLDANTGKHRSTVNIETASKVRSEIGHSLRFAKYRETSVAPPPAGEDGQPGVPHCPPCLTRSQPRPTIKLRRPQHESVQAKTRHAPPRFENPRGLKRRQRSR
jgi:hypothetical protein